jgi:iron complex transport system substrate-binding protein
MRERFCSRKKALRFDKRSKNFCLFAFVAAAVLVSEPSAANGVVSLNLCTDQLLVLLAPEQVAALEPLARDPALSFVAEQARDLPIVRADAEAVLALKPDLVLAGTYGAQGTLALLRARGVRVLQFGEPTDFAGIDAQVMRVAETLGVRTRGRVLVDAMWRHLAAVRKRSGAAVLWEAGGWSAGPGTLGDAVLRAAGFRDVGTGGRMGLEALLAAHPDLLVTEQAPRFPSMATDLAWHPALRGLPRRALAPAWLTCGGPFTVRAVEALSQ